MNVLSLLDQLGHVPAGPTARRQALALLGRHGWLAALPLLAPAGPAAATPAGTATASDSLQLLLLLERLQVALYTQALAAPGLALGTARADVQLLQAQQQLHVDFLGRALANAAVTVPAAPAFDFSGRRNSAANPTLFPNVFTSYGAFLELAQQLEDASVRIYLGQLPGLAADRPLYAAVLAMQATEARHAAHLRTLRRNTGLPVKSWPGTASPALGAPVTYPTGNTTATVYDDEANTRQIAPGPKLVPFATLLTAAGGTAVAANAAAEAFDEPLPTAAAQAVLALFS